MQYNSNTSNCSVLNVFWCWHPDTIITKCHNMEFSMDVALDFITVYTV